MLALVGGTSTEIHRQTGTFNGDVLWLRGPAMRSTTTPAPASDTAVALSATTHLGETDPRVTHPMMKGALRTCWRDLNTVQFGMTPAHAMTLGPMDTATGSFLSLLDGTRGLPLLHEQGHRMDLPAAHIDGLVERLSEAGLLDDATGGGPAVETLRGKKKVLERLGPDL